MVRIALALDSACASSPESHAEAIQAVCKLISFVRREFPSALVSVHTNARLVHGEWPADPTLLRDFQEVTTWTTLSALQALQSCFAAHNHAAGPGSPGSAGRSLRATPSRLAASGAWSLLNTVMDRLRESNTQDACLVVLCTALASSAPASKEDSIAKCVSRAATKLKATGGALLLVDTSAPRVLPGVRSPESLTFPEPHASWLDRYAVVVSSVRLNQSDACLPWMHIVRDILKAARSGAPLPSVPEEHVHTRRVVMHLGSKDDSRLLGLLHIPREGAEATQSGAPKSGARTGAWSGGPGSQALDGGDEAETMPPTCPEQQQRGPSDPVRLPGDALCVRGVVPLASMRGACDAAALDPSAQFPAIATGPMAAREGHTQHESVVPSSRGLPELLRHLVAANCGAVVACMDSDTLWLLEPLSPTHPTALLTRLWYLPDSLEPLPSMAPDLAQGQARSLEHRAVRQACQATPGAPAASGAQVQGALRELAARVLQDASEHPACRVVDPLGAHPWALGGQGATARQRCVALAGVGASGGGAGVGRTPSAGVRVADPVTPATALLPPTPGGEALRPTEVVKGVTVAPPAFLNDEAVDALVEEQREALRAMRERHKKEAVLEAVLAEASQHAPPGTDRKRRAAGVLLALATCVSRRARNACNDILAGMRSAASYVVPGVMERIAGEERAGSEGRRVADVLGQGAAMQALTRIKTELGSRGAGAVRDAYLALAAACLEAVAWAVAAEGAGGDAARKGRGKGRRAMAHLQLVELVMQKVRLSVLSGGAGSGHAVNDFASAFEGLCGAYRDRGLARLVERLQKDMVGTGEREMEQDGLAGTFAIADDAGDPGSSGENDPDVTNGPAPEGRGAPAAATLSDGECHSACKGKGGAPAAPAPAQRTRQQGKGAARAGGAAAELEAAKFKKRRGFRTRMVLRTVQAGAAGDNAAGPRRAGPRGEDGQGQGQATGEGGSGSSSEDEPGGFMDAGRAARMRGAGAGPGAGADAGAPPAAGQVPRTPTGGARARRARVAWLRSEDSASDLEGSGTVVGATPEMPGRWGAGRDLAEGWGAAEGLGAGGHRLDFDAVAGMGPDDDVSRGWSGGEAGMRAEGGEERGARGGAVGALSGSAEVGGDEVASDCAQRCGDVGGGESSSGIDAPWDAADCGWERGADGGVLGDEALGHGGVVGFDLDGEESHGAAPGTGEAGPTGSDTPCEGARDAEAGGDGQTDGGDGAGQAAPTALPDPLTEAETKRLRKWALSVVAGFRRLRNSSYFSAAFQLFLSIKFGCEQCGHSPLGCQACHAACMGCGKCRYMGCPGCFLGVLLALYYRGLDVTPEVEAFGKSRGFEPWPPRPAAPVELGQAATGVALAEGARAEAGRERSGAVVASVEGARADPDREGHVGLTGAGEAVSAGANTGEGVVGDEGPGRGAGTVGGGVMGQESGAVWGGDMEMYGGASLAEGCEGLEWGGGGEAMAAGVSQPGALVAFSEHAEGGPSRVVPGPASPLQGAPAGARESVSLNASGPDGEAGVTGRATTACASVNLPPTADSAGDGRASPGTQTSTATSPASSGSRSEAGEDASDAEGPAASEVSPTVWGSVQAQAPGAQVPDGTVAETPGGCQDRRCEAPHVAGAAGCCGASDAGHAHQQALPAPAVPGPEIIADHKALKAWAMHVTNGYEAFCTPGTLIQAIANIKRVKLGCNQCNGSRLGCPACRKLNFGRPMCPRCRIGDKCCRSCFLAVLLSLYLRGSDVTPDVAEVGKGRYEPWPPRPAAVSGVSCGAEVGGTAVRAGRQTGAGEGPMQGGVAGPTGLADSGTPQRASGRGEKREGAVAARGRGKREREQGHDAGAATRARVTRAKAGPEAGPAPTGEEGSEPHARGKRGTSSAPGAGQVKRARLAPRDGSEVHTGDGATRRAPKRAAGAVANAALAMHSARANGDMLRGLAESLASGHPQFQTPSVISDALAHYPRVQLGCFKCRTNDGCSSCQMASLGCSKCRHTSCRSCLLAVLLTLLVREGTPSAALGEHATKTYGTWPMQGAAGPS